MSDEKNSDKRHGLVAQIAPSDWDARPGTVATEIRELLKTLIDHGTSIDSGRSSDSADLWPQIGGVEYIITIRVSRELSKPDSVPIQ